MASAFSHFNYVHMVYKTLGGIDFEVAVLIPKRLILSGTPTCTPLLAHFHGGGLLVGTILDPYFVALWPLELAEAENAIIVSPAYRLLPEASGSEILDDVSDFWGWVQRTLPTQVQTRWPHLTVDLGQIAVWGESAGGYLALLSAFLHPEVDIKVVMPAYCGIFPDLTEFRSPALSTDEIAAANAVIDSYLASIRPGDIRILTPAPSLMSLIVSVFSVKSRLVEMMSREKRMTLDYGLDVAHKLPPMWILQGSEDHIVPHAATTEMVTRIQARRPETPLMYIVQPGDHGFDIKFSLEEPAIAEGIKFVRQYWPQGRERSSVTTSSQEHSS